MPIEFPTPGELYRGKCRRPLAISLIMTLVGILAMSVTVALISGKADVGMKMLVSVGIGSLLRLVIGLYVLGVLCHNGYKKTVNAWLVVKGLMLAGGIVVQILAIKSLKSQKSEGFCGACAALAMI